MNTEHAELYGQVSKRLMKAALEFTQGLREHFHPGEVGRMYLAVGAWLVGMAGGRGEAVAELRTLADSLEAGTERQTLN